MTDTHPHDERTDRDMVVAINVQIIVHADAWNALQADVVDPGYTDRLHPEESLPPTTASDLFVMDVRHEVGQVISQRVLANYVGKMRNSAVIVGDAHCTRLDPSPVYDPSQEEPF